MKVTMREAEVWASLVADHFELVGRNPTEVECATMVVLARAVVSASKSATMTDLIVGEGKAAK